MSVAVTGSSFTFTAIDDLTLFPNTFGPKWLAISSDEYFAMRRLDFAGEDILSGGALDDIIHGLGGDDELSGGLGNDALSGDLGDDRLDGGPGLDAGVWASDDLFTIDENGDVNAIEGRPQQIGFDFVFGAENTATAQDLSERDAFSNIEIIVGTDFGDSYSVDAPAFLAQSNDPLFLRLGDGNDLVEGAEFAAMVDYTQAQYGVQVDLGEGTATGYFIGRDQLVDVHAVMGSQVNDILNGSSEADVLVGGYGPDSIFGRDGDDQIFGGALFNTGVFFENRRNSDSDDANHADTLFGGDGDDFIVNESRHGEIRGDDGDDLIISAAGAGGVYSGGAGDDVIAGGFYTSVISADGGDDWLSIAGFGTDSYGGAGRDTADFSAFGIDVKVNLDSEFVTYQDTGRKALQDIERVIGGDGDDVLIGTELGNFLGGGDGDDLIVGRDGKDAMAGGRGDDTFAVQQAGDKVYENAGEGFDWINTWVDYRNAENVEGLNGRYAEDALKLIGNGGEERIYGSEFDDKVDGWRGDDWVAGLGGADYLNGGVGDDVLFGNGGDDILRGGGGDDRMAGQSGADRFVHRAGDGDDVIVDFAVGQDMLDLSGHDLASFYEFRVAARDVGDDVLIYLGDDGSLLLQGVSELDLSAGDVIL